MRSLYHAAICAVLALTTACSNSLPTGSTAPTATAPEFSNPVDRALGSTTVKHIVVIVQENRTVDNLFNGFPGADTRSWGRNEDGQIVVLRKTDLAAPYDISHKHKTWLADYAHGKLNGFSRDGENCYKDKDGCPPAAVAAYGYVPRDEVQPYWQMALQYGFADKMFQSNEGPSFPAHQYIISGTSSIADGSPYKAEDNAEAAKSGGKQGGCSSLPSATVVTIDSRGRSGPTVFPCFARNSIMQDMDNNDVTWRYFQERGGSGQWHAVDAIKDIWDGPTYDSVRHPSKRALTMIRRKSLVQVTFITPSARNSDHAGRNDGHGPDWVASVVNEIGESEYWPDTAIVVVWDDWGGWYDHVRPKIYNSYELGFRVPMIVISPYAKQGYVSHVHYEFGSILKFIEETFGLKSLDTTDARANDLSDFFDFTKPPRQFHPIKTSLSARFFENEPVDDRPVDDD
jgi:phospholipase C